MKIIVKRPSSLREDGGVGTQRNREREGYGRRKAEERAVGGSSGRVGTGRNMGKYATMHNIFN